MKKLMVLLVLVSMVLLAACGPGVAEDEEPALTPGGETAVPTTATDPYPAQETLPTATSGAAYPGLSASAVVTPAAYPGQADLSTATPQPGVPGGEQSVSQVVIEDLARRLAIETSAIELVRQEEVEWADSALGCPAPGMNYLQVITPGYEITLQADGATYTYHTDARGYFVLCGPQGQPVP